MDDLTIFLTLLALYDINVHPTFWNDTQNGGIHYSY